jgi:hypothetical protein
MEGDYSMKVMVENVICVCYSSISARFKCVHLNTTEFTKTFPAYTLCHHISLTLPKLKPESVKLIN